MAMESEKAINNDFNISTSQATSVLELAEVIWKILKPDTKFNYTCETGYKYDVQKRVPNTDKAKEVLGFEAEVGLEESVIEVVNYMVKKAHA